MHYAFSGGDASSSAPTTHQPIIAASGSCQSASDVIQKCTGMSYSLLSKLLGHSYDDHLTHQAPLPWSVQFIDAFNYYIPAPVFFILVLLIAALCIRGCSRSLRSFKKRVGSERQMGEKKKKTM